jgi:hypothetical protein
VSCSLLNIWSLTTAMPHQPPGLTTASRSGVVSRRSHCKNSVIVRAYCLGSQAGLPGMIAKLEENYGDATSTSWFDDRFKIWRDMATGAAVAYVPSSSNFAIGLPGMIAKLEELGT